MKGGFLLNCLCVDRLLRARVAQSKEVRLSRTRFLVRLSRQANQAFHRSEVSELVPDMYGKDNALTCLLTDNRNRLTQAG